jgi:hypothetical protein
MREVFFGWTTIKNNENYQKFSYHACFRGESAQNAEFLLKKSVFQRFFASGGRLSGFFQVSWFY